MLAVRSQPSASVAHPGGAMRFCRILVFCSSLLCPLLILGHPASAMNAASSSIQEAINRACDGKKPGRVVLPLGTITVASTIMVPSQCLVQGQGKNQTRLVAAAELDAPVLQLSSISNVELQGFTVDGNRDVNPHVLDSIKLIDASEVVLDHMGAVHALANGIEIGSGTLGVVVQNSEISGNGFPLPSPNGAGIAIAGGPQPILRIKMINNSIHDNNLGVAIFNSPGPARVEDITVSMNSFYGNADDGFSATISNPAGGKILGLRVVDNEAFCNGWPPRGSGFSPDCVPGMLQRGTVLSSSGVGFDFIGDGALLVQPIVSSNRSHDNVYDGFSTDAHVAASVNVVPGSPSVITTISGTFNQAWKPGQPVTVNSTTCLIASLINAVTLTVNCNLPAWTRARLLGPSWLGASFTGNNAYDNGNVEAHIGAGFWNEMSDGVTYSSNVAQLNAGAGFGCDACSYASYNGDRAYQNARDISQYHQGFYAAAASGNSYTGVCADDQQPVATQIFGITLDVNSSNAVISSLCLFGRSAVHVLGRNIVYNQSLISKKQD